MTWLSWNHNLQIQLTLQKIEAITNLYNSYNIREIAVTEMKRSLDIAFTALEKSKY